MDAAAVAAALPYKDSSNQSVFCHVLSAAETKGEQQCIVCKASVKVKSMREHAGSDVLQGHVSGDVCGFCGSTSVAAPHVAAPHARPAWRKTASQGSLRTALAT